MISLSNMKGLLSANMVTLMAIYQHNVTKSEH